MQSLAEQGQSRLQASGVGFSLYTIFLVPLIISITACYVLPSEHKSLVDEVAELKTRLIATEKEASIAIANASCGKEVVDLMKDVAALCTKELLCANSEILSAISDADSSGRFLFLMKTQRSAAFYFPQPWNNPIQRNRLSDIISKRQLSRTKFLIVSNSTPRKPAAARAPDDAAVDLANDRATKVVEQIKMVSEKMHIADSRILPIHDQDLRVWIVPYLVQDADLAYLGPNDQPPIGYMNITPSKQKQPQLQQLKQAVLQSVWVYLIDCWPADPPVSPASPSPSVDTTPTTTP